MMLTEKRDSGICGIPCRRSDSRTTSHFRTGDVYTLKITESLDNGRIHLKSRIVFPPMATQTSESGVPGERTAGHYEAVAQNPLVGLIITEYAYISKQGQSGDADQISMASDDVIPFHKAMTDRIHALNPKIKIFAQINHAGANSSEFVTGQELVSASNIQFGQSTARALTVPEIKQIEEQFAEAALRVKKAGYDGVEIHSAHGYLLNEFYSPLTNFRTDVYGSQSIENRTRFLRETIKAVRGAVGDDFPIAVRLGGSDYMQGGSTIEDATEAAVLLEDSGVDLIDLSGGMNGFTRRDNRKPGWFSDMSEAVKERVSVPVLVTGGVRTKEQAEELLVAGKADLIGVGRAVFGNPKWGEYGGNDL